MNQKQILSALRQLRRDVKAGWPIDSTSNGICWNTYAILRAQRICTSRNRPEIYDKLASYFRDWPQRQEDDAGGHYPIKHVSPSRWEGEELRLRLELLDWTINKLAGKK